MSEKRAVVWTGESGEPSVVYADEGVLVTVIPNWTLEYQENGRIISASKSEIEDLIEEIEEIEGAMEIGAVRQEIDDIRHILNQIEFCDDCGMDLDIDGGDGLDVLCGNCADGA